MKGFCCIVIFQFLFISCINSDNETKNVQIYYDLKGITFDRNLRTCLVLPEVGCGGCIDGAVYFLNENKEFYRKEQYRNMFILTAITSPKMTLRTLNESSLDQYYCVWDSTNRYLVKGNNSIYPLILYLNEGKIVKARYQSPFTEDVFGTLEKDIRK